VYANTQDELLDNLDKIFNKLESFNITLNPEKVRIGLRQVEYVGHTIDSEGLSFSREKIEDVLNFFLERSTVKNIEVIIDPERLRPIDADLQVPNTDKFKNHTGWEPAISFEQTMNDLLEYWRNKVKNGRTFLNR
jgi:GDP-D-mannose dehydratase